MTQIGSVAAVDRVDGVDRVDTAAKNSHRPKTKRPGKIGIIQSRVRAFLSNPQRVSTLSTVSTLTAGVGRKVS